jgi:hypothetical protein
MRKTGSEHQSAKITHVGFNGPRVPRSGVTSQGGVLPNFSHLLIVNKLLSLSDRVEFRILVGKLVDISRVKWDISVPTTCMRACRCQD